MSRKFGIEKAAAELANMLEADILAAFDSNPIESPIERLLYITFVSYCHSFLMEGYGPLNGLVAKPDEVLDEGEINLRQQVRILDWRVDFVVSVGVRERGRIRARRLAIECDGHDFHERTKEQAARDRSRDRALQAAGYTVMRFTGSELYRDPVGCVLEIAAWAASQVRSAQ